MPTALDWGTAYHITGWKEVIYACVHEDRRYVLYASVDDGQSWLPEMRLPGGVQVTVMVLRQDELLVGTAAHGVFAVGRRRRRGLFRGLPDGEPVIALSAHESTIVAATPTLGVFRLEEGTSWRPCNQGLPLGGRGVPLRAMATVSSGFLAAHRFGMHRLLLGASSWEPATLSPPVLVGLASELEGRVVGWDAKRVYISSDAGASWSAAASFRLEGLTLRSSVWNRGSIHVLARGPNGDQLFESSDGGRTFRDETGDLPPGVVRLAAGRTHLLAAVAGRGVWRRRSTVGSREKVEVPFILEQNAPNPFRAWTRIPFVLSSHAYAVLTLHDADSRRLNTLVDGELRRGRHEVDVDGLQLPPGFYSCKLTVGGFTQSRRMLRLD